MLASQQFRCAICKTDEPGNNGHWHVDHDHATGDTRDLLCGHCNLGLGHFRDKTEVLAAAIDYLNRHRGITHGLDASPKDDAGTSPIIR